ncbi:MAG: hypothetical protein BGO26_11305 [Actinobacteria bacterium 69-20]|jgi:hypothetical protein|nr:MAG: hypothetical protein BGO26_11305 [Actinobacteria bacterium 69-20]
MPAGAVHELPADPDSVPLLLWDEVSLPVDDSLWVGDWLLCDDEDDEDDDVLVPWPVPLLPHAALTTRTAPMVAARATRDIRRGDMVFAPWSSGVLLLTGHSVCWSGIGLTSHRMTPGRPGSV